MSTLNVTSIKGRAGATPNLPDGAIVSGIATIGTGGIDVTGVITATSLESDTKISAGSSITATSFYGSGANLSSLPSQSPLVTGIASGTIPANRAICVHSDGKVGLITGTKFTWGALTAVGSPVEKSSGSYGVLDVAYGDGKVFVITRDDGPVMCIAGTPNADNVSVTWGSWLEVETSTDGANRVIYCANQNKFVICYSHGTALKTRVATVTGTTVTVGASSQVIGAAPESVEMVYDPDTYKVIVVYKTGANTPYARVGTISGTSLSYGTQLTIEASGNSNGPVTYDTKNNKVIIALGYDGSNSNRGWSYIGTVSGTDITAVSAGEINYNYSGSTRLQLIYDEEREKIVFTGFNINNLQYEAILGIYVSGTSISWGAPAMIEKYTSITSSQSSLAYDPYGKIYAILYNNTSGDLVKYSRGTINPIDSSEPEMMTWSTPTQFYKGSYGSITIGNIGNSFLMAHGTSAGSMYAGSPVFGLYYRLEGFRNSTLAYDGDNYIGYSADAYTDGQTATVQIVGNVSTQVGLTPGLKYYIQGDGGLVSYIDPNFPTSTEAGIALDATKLLIK